MTEAKIQAVIDYFKEHERDFEDCIEALDSYDGYLNERRCWDMGEIDELEHWTTPLEVLRKVFYGYSDDRDYVDNRGQKKHGEFCPMENYFYYNGYGNLVSTDHKDYSDFLDEYFVKELVEYRNRLGWIEDTEIAELLDALEEGDDAD